jgi:hypothetical protein
MFDQPSPNRLAIFPAIGEAYEFLWANRNDFARMSALPVLILAFADVIAIALFPLQEGRVTYQALAVMLAPAVFLYAMFSVAWHRRFLRSSETSTFWEALRWDGRKTVFLLRLVAIFLCVALISLSPTIIVAIVGGILSIMSGAAGASVVAPQGIGLLGSAVVMMIALLLYARLSLWLPATAVDDKYGPVAIWTLGQGNSWSLVGITLGAALPMMIGAIAIASFVQSFVMGIGINTHLTGRFIAALASGFCNYVTLAAEITALSIAYQKLSRPADPGMPIFRND